MCCLASLGNFSSPMALKNFATNIKALTEVLTFSAAAAISLPLPIVVSLKRNLDPCQARCSAQLGRSYNGLNNNRGSSQRLSPDQAPPIAVGSYQLSRRGYNNNRAISQDSPCLKWQNFGKTNFVHPPMNLPNSLIMREAS